MLTTQLAHPSAHSIQSRFWAAPWWIRVLGIYFFTRVISTIILVAATRQQIADRTTGMPAVPDYWQFLDTWDSLWYRAIFWYWYPENLPFGDDGTVQGNNWAFYPIFPLIVRLLNSGSNNVLNIDAGWMPLAAWVATFAGAGASLLIYKIFRLVAGTKAATWATLLVFVYPAAAIFQIPYAESLSLLILAAALYFTVKHQYFWALPFIVLNSLARPLGPAFACFAVLHFLGRITVLTERQKKSPIKESGTPKQSQPMASLIKEFLLTPLSMLSSHQIRFRKNPFSGAKDLIGTLSFLAVSLFGAVLWPFIAWQVTNYPRAYLETESKWRGEELVYFKPWIDLSLKLFGPFFGPVVLIVTLLLLSAVMFSQPVKKIGLDLRLWCTAYILYLLAVFHPTTSTFRLLIPLFPLALAAILVSKSRSYRTLLIITSIALQAIWVVWLWVAWPTPDGIGDGAWP